MARGMARSALCSISSTRACGSCIMLAQAEASLRMGSPASSFSLKVRVSCMSFQCLRGVLQYVGVRSLQKQMKELWRRNMGMNGWTEAHQLLPEGLLLFCG